MYKTMLTSKLSLRVSPEQEAALAEASKLTGIGTAAIARLAIDAYTASIIASASTRQEDARV